MKIYSRIKRFILTPMIKFHRFRMRKRRIKSADLKMKWPEEILDETNKLKKIFLKYEREGLKEEAYEVKIKIKILEWILNKNDTSS